MNIIYNENSEPLCLVCGKPITENATIEHIIPKSIMRYHNLYDDIANQEWNLSKSHKHCNEFRSGSFIYSAVKPHCL